MLVSSYDKDLSYDWSTDGGYKDFADDPDLNFYSIKQSKVHQHRPNSKKQRVSSAFNKKEISLPKTNLTKKGQLCLYTENIPNNTGYTPKSYLPGDFNLSVVSKPYNFTKKWIDNLTDNFSLNASSILKERYDQLADENAGKFSDAVGRHSNYFINTLRTKSAKDRCMTKASYEEYLPADYDAKGELEETLRSYANSRNQNDKTPSDLYRDTNSRQTFMSFYNDENNLLRSETDLNYSSQFMDKSKLKKNNSKLSSQPILSARVLISNLSNNNNNNSQYMGNANPRKPNIENLTHNSTNFEYKSEFHIENSQEKETFEEGQNFVLDDFGNSELELQKKKAELINKTVNEEILRKKLNAEVALDEELKKLDLKKKTERNIYGKRFTGQRNKKEHDDIMERKKLLGKREENNSKKLMSSLVVKIPVLQAQSTSRTEDLNTISSVKVETEATRSDGSKITSYRMVNRTPIIQQQIRKKAEQKRPSTGLTQRPEPSKNKPQSAPTRRQSNTIARQATAENNSKNESSVKHVDEGRSSAFSMESKMTEENDLIFEQGSQSMSYFNNPSRISIVDKDTLYSTDLDQYMTNNFDNFEPITISITEIPHQDSTVKVRRYFDRETLRIKSMKIGSADKRNRIDSAKSNNLKLANSNLHRLKDEAGESRLDCESKLNLCTNSMTTLVNDMGTGDIHGLTTPTKTERFTKELENKTSSKGKLYSSSSRIRSAPGTNTRMLDSKLDERKVKSAMGEVHLGNKSTKSRVSSASSASKQGSRHGVRFFDVVDEKSLKSQCSTDSTMSHDTSAVVVSNISKIVLTEKPNSRIDKDLYKINENSDNIEKNNNKEFQLDYSIQDNEDENYVKEFTEAMDPGESDKLKDKILEDLNYKSNQISEIRQVDAELHKELADFKKEFEKSTGNNQNKNTDAKSVKNPLVEQKSVNFIVSTNDMTETANQASVESKDSPGLTGTVGFAEHRKNSNESSKTDETLDYATSEVSKPVKLGEDKTESSPDIVNEEASNFVELQREEDKKKKEIEAKNEEIMTTVSEDLLKSLISYKPIKSQEMALIRSASISPNLLQVPQSPSPTQTEPKKEKSLIKQSSLNSSRTPVSPSIMKSSKKVGFSDHVTSKVIQDMPNLLEKKPVVRTPEPPNSSILKKTDEVKTAENKPSITKISDAIKIINSQIPVEKENPVKAESSNVLITQTTSDINNEEMLVKQHEVLEEILDGIQANQVQEPDVETVEETESRLVGSSEIDADDLHDQDYEDNAQVEKFYKEMFPNVTILNPSTEEQQIAAGKKFHELQEGLKVKPTFFRNSNTPKIHTARYPHLEIPWDSKDAIVNQAEYNRAFEVPEVLCPRVYEINASKTSVEELLLERKILEEKINEIRANRVDKLLNKYNKPNQEEDEEAKKERTRKGSITVKDTSKEYSQKEKEYNEQRLRLQNETLKKQLEMESIEQLLISNINHKADEMTSLINALNKNSEEFENNMKSIESQLNYLDTNIAEIKDMVLSSRAQAREELTQSHMERRKAQRVKQQIARDEKYAEFDEKIRVIDNTIETEKLDEYMLGELEKEKYTLESELQLWMIKFERSVQEDNRALDEQEMQEDNRFTMVETNSEEEAFRLVKKEREDLLQEYQTLPVKHEQMKTKIISRIEEIKIEKEKIDLEKKSFDENMQKDLEHKKVKLVELLQTEHEARMQIKRELDQYRASIFKKRENNLKMKCDLSLLRHTHGVSKSYEIAYMLPLFPKQKTESDIEKGKEEKKKSKGKGKK